MKKTAFTLLELIIVIIVVGILASLALPRFMKSVECARTKEMLDLIPSVRLELEDCFARTGNYATCVVGNWPTNSQSEIDKYLGYCVQVDGEVGYEDYYRLIIFKENGDGACNPGDSHQFYNGESLGVDLRSDNTGKYKYYDYKGCFKNPSDDPDWRG